MLPRLMARRILEPALALSDGLRLVCHEGKEKQLLAELAIHNLDIVLTDTPVKSGMRVKVYSHLLGECGVTFCAVESLARPLRQGFYNKISTYLGYEWHTQKDRCKMAHLKVIPRNQIIFRRPLK